MDEYGLCQSSTGIAFATSKVLLASLDLGSGLVEHYQEEFKGEQRTKFYPINVEFGRRVTRFRHSTAAVARNYLPQEANISWRASYQR